jgi:hypothetical protein
MLAAYKQRASKLFAEAILSLSNCDQFAGMDALVYLAAFRPRITDVIAQDLFLLENSQSDSKRAVIVGGWPGVTSLALTLAGFETVLVDHPSVLSEQSRVGLRRLGVETLAIKMEELSESVEFKKLGPVALVECCECIEHWNFCPKPHLESMVQLIERNSGRLFVTVPNIASLYQRARLLFGKSIYCDLAAFEKELREPKDRAFERHWREYTKAELVALVNASGAKVDSVWYQFHPRLDKRGLLRTCFNLTQRLCAPFREHVGIVALRYDYADGG